MAKFKLWTADFVTAEVHCTRFLVDLDLDLDLDPVWSSQIETISQFLLV